MPSGQALSSRPVSRAKPTCVNCFFFLLSGWTDSGTQNAGVRRMSSSRATEKEPNQTRQIRASRVGTFSRQCLRIARDASPGAEADGRNIARAKQKQQHTMHAPTHQRRAASSTRVRKPKPKPKPVKAVTALTADRIVPSNQPRKAVSSENKIWNMCIKYCLHACN
jgi:hypothetical protein